MGIAWNVGKYTQADVLRLVPLLSGKTLQNWIFRGLIPMSPETKGRGDHRKYTPAGVVMLDFVSRVAAHGVPIADAFEMSEDVAQRAEDIEQQLAAMPSQVSPNGARTVIIDVAAMETFERHRVNTIPGGTVYLEPWGATLSPFERMHNQVTLVVETDLIIADSINRMALFETGDLPAQAPNRGVV